MTLEQAYKKLKEEYRIATRDLNRLKAGTYTDEEKAAQEKKIRELNSQIEKLNKQFKAYQIKIQRLSGEIDNLVIMIGNLEEEKKNLEYDLQATKEENNNLKNEVSKLRAQINRDFETSSKPSSDKPVHKIITNNREKTNNKPGAQVGHKGHKRKNFETDNIIFIEAPDDIKNNTDFYRTGKQYIRKMVDIEISVKTTSYVADEYRSKTTRKRYHAPFPTGIKNEVNYGANTKAVAFVLNNYCNVSIDKVKDFISELTQGQITMSKGFISQLTKEFSAKSEEERNKIFSKLEKAPVLYTDATVGRVNGIGKAVIVCATPEETLYFFKDHKGHEGIKDTPVKNSLGTLVHDHDKTFYSYGGSHQECLAHILRYLKDAVVNEPELTWHNKMHALLQEIIHTFKECGGNLPDDKKEDFSQRYSQILYLARKEYDEHPHAKWYPNGYNLQKRLYEYKDATLYFINHPEVESTNNRCERLCRAYKRKKMQMVTHRSQKCAEALCNCLGILMTNRLQGNNMLLASQNIFMNDVTLT